IGSSTSAASSRTSAIAKGEVQSTNRDRVATALESMAKSVAEERRITLLDVGHQRQHRRRVVGQYFDLRQRCSSGRVLDIGMERARTALVDRQLLDLGGVEKILQHARGVGMRSIGEDRRWRS